MPVSPIAGVRGLRRPWHLLAPVVALVVAGCSGGFDPLAQQAPTGPTVEVEVRQRPTSSLVATSIVSRVAAVDRPALDATVVAELANPTENGAPLVFQVVREQDGWLEVLLPVRPNGTTGWISAELVDLSVNPYRIEIDVSAHRLTLWEAGRLQLDAPVAIGTGATPTPIGSFYLTELLRPPDPSGPYGTHAYGLSGYSETLRHFNGGDGVIGLHGTDDPSSLGRNVSHGCVRLANETIDDLAAILPLGTPVVIHG